MTDPALFFSESTVGSRTRVRSRSHRNSAWRNSTWAESTARVFGCDLRSLAAFRIALGVCVIWDLIFRFPTITEMYSDRGFFTRDASFEYQQLVFGDGWQNWSWSFYWLWGSPGFQVALFVVAAVFALMLAAGYRTRIVTIASWALLCSLHVRNPLVISSGDFLLKMMLFWSMFLPLGKVWSLDAWLGRKPAGEHPAENSGSQSDAEMTDVAAVEANEETEPRAEIVPPVDAELDSVLLKSAGELNSDPDKRYVSVATGCLIVQLFLMYFFCGVAKWNQTWWYGEAMQYVLHLDIFVTDFGKSLLEFPQLLKLTSLATVLAEAFLIWTIFSPAYTDWYRCLNLIVFWCFHLGIALAMSIGMFPVICIIAWLPLIPGSWWARLGSLIPGKLRFRRWGLKPLNLMRFSLKRFSLKRFSLKRFNPKRFNPKRFNPKRFNPKRFSLKRLNLRLLKLKRLGFGFFRDKREMPDVEPVIESDITQNEFVNAHSGRLESYLSKPTQVICGFVLAYCVLWNFANIKQSGLNKVLSPDLFKPGRMLNLDQHFQMFGHPPTTNPWFVYEATLADGTKVDLYTCESINRDRPDSVLKAMPDFHWRRLHRNLVNDRQTLREPLGEYFIRRWNEAHESEQHVARFRLICYEEPIGPEFNINNRHSKIWYSFRDEEEGAGSVFDSILDGLKGHVEEIGGLGL